MKRSVVIKRLGYEASAGWTTYGTSLAAMKLGAQCLLVACGHIKIVPHHKNDVNFVGITLGCDIAAETEQFAPDRRSDTYSDERSEYLLLASKSKELC